VPRIRKKSYHSRSRIRGQGVSRSIAECGVKWQPILKFTIERKTATRVKERRKTFGEGKGGKGSGSGRQKGGGWKEEKSEVSGCEPWKRG